jgi:hypothetical protein
MILFVKLPIGLCNLLNIFFLVVNTSKVAMDLS